MIDNQLALNLLFLNSNEGKTNQGTPVKTYIKMLQNDTGLKEEREIRSIIIDRMTDDDDKVTWKI